MNNTIEKKTAEFGFRVKSRMYTVVCHCKNNIWEVCDECTRFE